MHKGIIFESGQFRPYEYRPYPGWFNGKLYKTKEEYDKATRTVDRGRPDAATRPGGEVGQTVTKKTTSKLIFSEG